MNSRQKELVHSTTSKVFVSLLHLVKESKPDDGFDTNTLGLFTLFFSKMIVYHSWDFQMCIVLVVANYKTCIDQSTSHKINSNWGFSLGTHNMDIY